LPSEPERAGSKRLDAPSELRTLEPVSRTLPGSVTGLPASPAGASPFDQELLDGIRAIGHHPFILVRAGSPGPDARQLIFCPTQNEAGAFVDTLAQLPDFSQSRLLRGIERALQQEIYDAADLLFSWTRESGGAR